MRNIKTVIETLKIIRKFYERVGWEEESLKVDDIVYDILNSQTR